MVTLLVWVGLVLLFGVGLVVYACVLVGAWADEDQEKWERLIDD